MLAEITNLQNFRVKVLGSENTPLFHYARALTLLVCLNESLDIFSNPVNVLNPTAAVHGQQKSERAKTVLVKNLVEKSCGAVKIVHKNVV